MNDVVIRVEGISKRYRVGEREGYLALRDVLSRAMHLRFNGKRGSKDFVWAVRDVSFEVRQGEVVGLIGRNGAGKTTLLKLLARITRPTSGRAEIRGRIGSLLEVGTGFHPELTGHENIYLSGAILGMSKKEIDRKYDAIVTFAEVERFIHAPLKHYSSGMQTRLAFAVAAHLDPEILLVDEVLAVGDASFQKKCLGKMEEVSRAGRTILFVSHNASAVTRLCDRCILLYSGKIIADGSAHAVISEYLRSDLLTSAAREWTPDEAPGDEIVRLRRVCARNSHGEISEAFDIREPVAVDLVFDVLEDGKILVPNVHIYNELGVTVFVTIDQDQSWRRRPRRAGRYVSTVWIPGNFLAEGSFIADAAITTFVPMNVHLHERAVIGFQIIDSADGNSARGDYAGNLPGAVRPILKWETVFEPRQKDFRLRHHAVKDRAFPMEFE